jgi:hypothetical protein
MSIALLMRIEALERQVKALEVLLAAREAAADAAAPKAVARPVGSKSKRR